jgi:hypothetical protein
MDHVLALPLQLSRAHQYFERGLYSDVVHSRG